MSWRRRLEGICRYARKAGWFVVPIEASGVHGTLHFTRKFWDADGFIVEDGVFGECGFKMGDFRGETVLASCPHPSCFRVVHMLTMPFSSRRRPVPVDSHFRAIRLLAECAKSEDNMVSRINASAYQLLVWWSLM